jgi:RNA polymerase sigma-70 factor (ECF subfamily)
MFLLADGTEHSLRVQRAGLGKEVSMAKVKRVVLSPDLTDRERQYVFSVAMKYLKDPDAAEDVTQDALLLAHRHRDSFRGDSRFSTWLYRVAATTALMYLRKQRRRGREVPMPVRIDDERDAPPAIEPGDAESGPDARVAAAEEVALADRRLRAMGARYRQVFWMRFADGYSEAEIAERLGLHLSTVKTRTHRARQAVRAALADAELAAA